MSKQPNTQHPEPHSKGQSFSSSINPSPDLTLTIKQQQTIEQILHETFSKSAITSPSPSQQSTLQYHYSYPHCTLQNEYELDEDLDRLLKQSQIKIGEQYENMAKQQIANNRIGITINDQHDRLKEIFLKMDMSKSETNKDRSSCGDSVRNSRKPFQIDTKKLKNNYLDFDISEGTSPNKRIRSYSTTLVNFQQPGHPNSQPNSQSSSSEQEKLQVPQPRPQPHVLQPHLLQKYENEQIISPKQQSLQIQALDKKYPKISPTSMYKFQYPIFKWGQSSVTKYLKYLRKCLKDIQCAITFWVSVSCKWTILGIDGMLYIFVGQDWKQPVIANPQQTNPYPSPIKHLSVSKSASHLCVALQTQILLYGIKKQSNSLVLIKNLSASNDINTKFVSINKCIIYCQNPVKIAYLDCRKNVGLIVCDQGMLFMRISEKQIKHGLDNVQDIDVLVLDNPSSSNTSSPVPSSKFSMKINQKLSNLMTKTNPTYLSITSLENLSLWSLQPNPIQIQNQQLNQKTSQLSPICRWRNFPQLQSKPQLLVCVNNKIYIYKLNDHNISSSSQMQNNVELQLHLVYRNHYGIMLMEILSNTHLLLVSNQNIIVVAVPLIPSTEIDDSLGHEMFESAIVFIASQPNIRVLHTSLDQCLYYSSKSESLRLATLVPLQQYLNCLTLQQGHFREAFTLLILISKGLNYSFKFSYLPQSLTQCIFTAVQCTISSFRISMNTNIIQYRLSWICQLLVQTKNQSMIWGCVWTKLTEKQKEREKQWAKGMIEPIQQSKVKQQKDFYRSSRDILELQKKSNIENQQKQKKKRFLQHHLSMNLPETPSLELQTEAPTTLQSILFTILELFVMKSQISLIPQHIFFQFIAYQCQKHSDTVVEKAILQNKQLYDGAKLLSLLQNKDRNYLMLYLFSRAIVCEEPDFYTGFVKVFGAYRKISEQGERNFIKQKQEDLRIYNMGMLCLWYLSKCLRFQRIPQGIMPLNEKITIVQTLCVQVLEPAITRKLFDLNKKIFLETMLMMVGGGELCMMIQEQNQFLVTKYKEYFQSVYQNIMSMPKPQVQLQKQTETQSQSEVFDKSFKQLLLIHLQKTIPMLSNQKLLWAQFQALAFYYNKTEICLSFQTTIDILIVLFQNKVDSYSLHNHIKHLQRPTIQNLELCLIDYIKPILIQRKDRFYINKLISFNDKNVSYYLYRIDQNYRLALQHFLNATDSNLNVKNGADPNQKNKLIKFIYEILDDIKNGTVAKELKERKFAEIKGFLIKNVGWLFKIDKFQALNLFYEIGQTSQTIYKIIQQNMGNKLDFLTAVLKKFENEDFQLKQRFQLEHLSQVCLLKNKQMLKYLDEFFYPLDSAIIVCEQKGNLLAKALFQQRCGKIVQAFNSYERMVKSLIQSNKHRSEKQIKHNVRKYTEQLLRLCKQSAYDPNSAPEQNLWLRIINFINSFIKSNIQHKVFLKVQFEKVLQHILSEMFQFLPTTMLTDFFISKGYKLQLSTTKQYSIYENLFVLGKFDVGVSRKVIDICKIDIKGTRKQTFIKRKKGIVCYGYCDFCRKQLKEESTCSLYSCRHCFHKICHNDSFKCLTCYFESDNSILKSNIFGSQLQKMLQQQQASISEKSEKQKNSLSQSLKTFNIIVESAQLARQESLKKKMKIFDFNDEKRQNLFNTIVEEYKKMQKDEEKEKEKQRLQNLEAFENEYIKYTKDGGLEVKAKEQQQTQPQYEQQQFQ